MVPDPRPGNEYPPPLFQEPLIEREGDSVCTLICSLMYIGSLYQRTVQEKITCCYKLFLLSLLPDTKELSVNQMKVANIVTQAVLGAAVIVLFVLHFGRKPESSSKGQQVNMEGLTTPSDIAIAYFNMDTVMSQWDLYFQYQQELQQRQTELESDFEGRTQNFRKSVEDAQYKIQRGLVTRSEAENLQQQLATQEQSLMNLQNQYGLQLQEEGLVKNRKMIDMIERYVAELSRERGYSYVFSYQFGGNVIYGAQPFNITGDVVNGLNEKYKPGTDID
ncbi:MAG: OmpH family outer membrane protein [Bacteroidetes bacterium]|nr:MAG: OmpH family outer membrane protein [Bacteroidota bacterium]